MATENADRFLKDAEPEKITEKELKKLRTTKTKQKIFLERFVVRVEGE